MYAEIKSSNGISLVPVESRLLAERKIIIEGEITPETACEFVRQALYLNTVSSSAPIDVLINSPGGEIDSGMLMYDVIQSSKAPMRLFCIGRAYSMAAVLFASGVNGRFILPHSKLMIHEPLLGCPVSGNSSSIKSISDNLIERKRILNSILAKHTGRSEEELETAMSYDHYFTPEESIEFGLGDEIVGFDRIMEGKR